EEVGRHDDGPAAVESHDRRVVAGLDAHEQVARSVAGGGRQDSAEHPLQLPGRDLARAAPARGELGQAELAGEGHAPILARRSSRSRCGTTTYFGSRAEARPASKMPNRIVSDPATYAAPASRRSGRHRAPATVRA